MQPLEIAGDAPYPKMGSNTSVPKRLQKKRGVLRTDQMGKKKRHTFYRTV